MKHLTFDGLRERGGNAWIKYDGISMYVRINPPQFHQHLGTVTIANMNAKQPGQGALTRFLDRYEPEERFQFENVLNIRLIAYLARRGYRIRGNDHFNYPPSMLFKEPAIKGWFVKDFADGWIYFDTKADAERQREGNDAIMLAGFAP